MRGLPTAPSRQPSWETKRGECMRRKSSFAGAFIAALATAVVAAGGATAAGSSAAGPPVATNYLLCGMWTQGSDRVSGQSTIDHPSGASSNGQQYDYSGQNCDNEYNGAGGFSNGSGQYTWTISHSNVDTRGERESGTEHGMF